MEFVYHAVTEKPMALGQKIIFDDSHHNGVYNRVMTFKRIVDGDDVSGELADFIKSDLDRWAKVAYRELALEAVRKEHYPKYPSRMACLYTSRTLEDAEKWAGFFHKIGRKVYSVVKLKIIGNIFDGDACNCFDGTIDEDENTKNAHHYWKMDVVNEKPVIETLVDGDITVVEIIKEFYLT